MQILGTGLNALKATLETGLGDLVSSRAEDPLDERDPEFIDATVEVYDALLKPYFRPKVTGLENIPAEGPVLLVGNHSGGTLIADTLVFGAAFYSHCGADRRFHQLAHDVAVALPGIGTAIRRYGALSASHDNARRAIARGAPVLVYPGGDYESFRPSWHSEAVEFGGRSGFVKLALSQDVPIVPVVSIGGQETALFLGRGERVAKLLMLDRLFRLKVLPLSIAVPWGLNVGDMLGHFPLPAKITVEVLPPINLKEEFGEDPDLDEVYDHVLRVMQETLDALAAERRLPVLG